MTIQDKELLGDSMDMFAHGNEELNRAAPQEAAPEPIRTEPAPAPAGTERPRDDHGRFAANETAPAPVPAPAPQAQVPAPVKADVDPGKEPLTKAEFKGMLEEREKRQRAEKEAADLRARLQQFEQQPTQIPSVQDDPDAFARYQQDLVNSTRTSTVFDMSEVMAREKHGDAPVSQAMDWALQQAQASPAFAAEYLKQKHPIDWAVKQQKRHATMNDIGDDADAYVRRRAAELGLTGAAPQPQAEAQPSQAASPHLASQQPAPAPVPAPTRSIANATSAGGLQVAVPSGEFAAIDGMFNR